MSIKICICNMKGGVAKTTTTSIVAACLTRKGYKVLCIDLDPQGNLSSLSRRERTEEDRGKGIHNVLKAGIASKKAQKLSKVENIEDIDEAAVMSLFSEKESQRNETAKDNIVKGKHYDIIPADDGLSAVEMQLSQNGSRFVLREAIDGAGLDQQYDFILFDTRPTFATLVVNALVAADYMLIPITADDFSIQGVSEMNEIQRVIVKHDNPKLRILGILRTRWDERLKVSKVTDQILSIANRALKTTIFPYIRNSVVVSESIHAKQNLIDYAEDSTVAQDYIAFTDALIKEVGLA